MLRKRGIPSESFVGRPRRIHPGRTFCITLERGGVRGSRAKSGVHGVFAPGRAYRLYRLLPAAWRRARNHQKWKSTGRSGISGDLKPNLGSSTISLGVAYTVGKGNWNVHCLFVSLSFITNNCLWLATAASLSAYLSR